MDTCRVSMWLMLLLSVAADPAERKHRRFLQRSTIAPSKSTANPLSNLSPLKIEQAPLFSSYRRMLQDNPLAEAQAIGGALGAPFSPASAPTSDPAAESSSGAAMWAELADNTPATAGSTQALYAVQVPQLADMHSSASLIDHSKNLALLDHLQVQHVLEASKLSLQHAMDKVWANVNASFDIVKELPEEIASFPHDVAEDLATAASTFEEEAFNATYALDAFDHFRHQLEDPVAVETSASVFSFSPCFFHADVGALEAFATGINVGASVLSVSPSGLTIQPQALSITPTLLSVGASGVNVQPDGLNISPSLIAVTPGRVSVNAKGGGISPVGLSVTAP